MTQSYYQFGGFRPHVNWFQYDDTKLSEAIAGKNSPLKATDATGAGYVEVVLGITLKGTSHLLLSIDQMRAVVRRLDVAGPRGHPAPASAFESLSPIRFSSAEELHRKLHTLKFKPHKGRESTDNSQANKHFLTGEEGIYRGRFEHGRVFYRILQNNLNLEQYGIDSTPKMQSIRICSFVFNTPKVEKRTILERTERPDPLDLGWAEATVPDLLLDNSLAKHFVIQEREFISQGTRKLAFKHGTTEKLRRDVVSSRIQELFQVKTGSQHMILLVHGEERSKNALKHMGVDVSKWHSGIKDLLGYKTDGFRDRRVEKSTSNYLQGQSSTDPRGQNAFNEYAQRRSRPRSRSRSPSRDVKYPPHSSPYGRLNSPPLPYNDDKSSLKFSPESDSLRVNVVDLNQLYSKMMQSESERVALDVNRIAQRFGLTHDIGWCAGNEAAWAIEIWRAMISGPAIDEQRAIRNTGPMAMQTDDPQNLPLAEPLVVNDGGSDDEQDPNDIIQVNRAVNPPAVGSVDPYDLNSDSEDGEWD